MYTSAIYIEKINPINFFFKACIFSIEIKKTNSLVSILIDILNQGGRSVLFYFK